MKTRIYICYLFPQPSGYGVMGGFVEDYDDNLDLQVVHCDNSITLSLPSEAIYLSAACAYDEALFSNSIESPAS